MHGSRRALLCESLRPRFTEWQRLAAEFGTPLLVLNPKADGQLVRVAHKLIRKDAEERYQTAEEVYEALSE